jgi:hypothetical protein
MTCASDYHKAIVTLSNRSKPNNPTAEEEAAWYTKWNTDMDAINKNFTNCNPGGSRRKKRKMARKSRKNKSRRFRRN